MTARHVGLASLTAAVLTLAACTAVDRSDDGSGAIVPPSGANSTASTLRTPAPASTTDQENVMRIVITVEGHRFLATLTDSAAARDLLAQLPLSLRMTDHDGVEKTGRLPQPLSLAGEPRGADPDVGDIGDYAPGQDLVLYYGDQTYYEGIIANRLRNWDSREPTCICRTSSVGVRGSSPLSSNREPQVRAHPPGNEAPLPH